MTETNEKVEPKPIDLGEYKYGLSDEVTTVNYKGNGINDTKVSTMYY